MLYNCIFRDVGVFSCISSHKGIDPITISGIAVAAGSLLSNLLGAKSQSDINKANIQNQNDLFQKQKDYQNFLNANGTLIQRQALEKAGMNVNAEFGPAVNTTASVPQMAKQDAFMPDMSSVLSFLSNMPNMKLQEEQAEYQSIINEREKNKDKAANKYMTDANDLNNDLSETLASIGVNPEIAGLHVDNVLPEAESKGKAHRYNLGDFDFKKMAKSFEHDLAQYSVDDAKWALDKLVYNAQAKDKDILDYLKRMPEAQFKLLVDKSKEAVAHSSLMGQQEKTSEKQGKLFDAQEAYTQIQKQIAEDNNLSQIFDDMIKNGLSIENVGKMLIACFVQWLKPR